MEKISEAELALLARKRMKRAEFDCKDLNNRPMKLDFTLWIKNMSHFTKFNVQRYESNPPFESGGHKWVLVVYPEGINPVRKKGGHISVHLKLITDGDMMISDTTVAARFRIFLYNYIKKKFFLVEGSGHLFGEFNRQHNEMGYPNFIPLATFREPGNGYLVDDQCAFAVEVFVQKYRPTGDYLSMIDSPVLKTFTWRIKNFSKAKGSVFVPLDFDNGEASLFSPSFFVGGPMWLMEKISEAELALLARKRMKRAEFDCKDLNNRPMKLDFTLWIKNMSHFTKFNVQRYESNPPFESGGHKWVLVVYPEGIDPVRKKGGHISVLLKLITDGDMMISDTTVPTRFRIFLYNNIKKKFFLVEGSGHLFWEFNRQHNEMGYPYFIPLATFREPGNGYLVDDQCAFAVEVFVQKYRPTGDYLSMIDSPVLKTFTWRIENFSKAKGSVFVPLDFDNGEASLFSPSFFVGGPMCQIQIYPKGDDQEKNKFASLFLCFFPPAEDINDCVKVCAKCILRVRNQSSGEHVQNEITDWFTLLPVGWSNFIPLDVLNDPSRGFLVNDTLFIDAEVTVYGSAKFFNEDPMYHGTI